MNYCLSFRVFDSKLNFPNLLKLKFKVQVIAMIVVGYKISIFTILFLHFLLSFSFDREAR